MWSSQPALGKQAAHAADIPVTGELGSVSGMCELHTAEQGLPLSHAIPSLLLLYLVMPAEVFTSNL